MPRLSPYCPAIPASRLIRWRSAGPAAVGDRLPALAADGGRRLLIDPDPARRRATLGTALAGLPADTLLAVAGVDGTGTGRDPAVLLHDWLGQLRAGLGDPQPLPLAVDDLVAAIPGWLARAGAGRGAMVALDAVDSLSPEPPAGWLPDYLPPRVGMIVGCAPGALADRLTAAGWDPIELPAAGDAATASTYPPAGPLLQALRASADGLDDALVERLDPGGSQRRELRRLLRRRPGGLTLAAPPSGPESAADNLGAELRAIAAAEPPDSLPALQLCIAIEAWQDAATRLADPALLAAWPNAAPQLLAAWHRLPMSELTLERLLAVLADDSPRCFAAIDLLSALGHDDRARALLERVAEATRDRGDDIEAEALQRRAELALDQGETGTAREWLERALQLRHRQTPDSAAARSTRHALARTLETAGDLDAAEAFYRSAVAEFLERGRGNHPGVIHALTNLAAVQRAGNRLEPALDNLQTALKVAERQLGADHPITISLQDSLGGLRYGGGDLEAAEQHYREAVTRAERAFGTASEATAACWHNLGTLLDARGEYREAEDRFRRALAVRRARRGDFDADTASSLHNLAGVLEVTGRGDEAEGLYREAVSVWERLVGEDHPATATSINNLADLLRERGERDEAEQLYRRNLGIWERLYGTDHPNTLMTRAELGGLYADAGRHADAERLLQPALDGLTRRLGATAGLAVDAALRLAAVWRDTGRGEAALALLEGTLDAAAGGVATLSPRLQKVRRHRDALRAQLTGSGLHG
jgi:tetratricopeptide (TPR) repeat protein